MISYSTRRVFCNHCKGIYVEGILWAAGKCRPTTAFACYLATWAGILPWNSNIIFEIGYSKIHFGKFEQDKSGYNEFVSSGSWLLLCLFG